MYKGDLLAVLEVKKVKQKRWYQVHRFDPDSLQHLGAFSGFPQRRDPDGEAALLPLADGSLVWVPHSMPLLLLPAAGSDHQTTDFIHVMGDELPVRIMHMPEEWYDQEIGDSGLLDDLVAATPAQRRSLARYLLNELMDDDRFEKLLLFDWEAFAPYREILLYWNSADLELLRKMDYRHWWRLSRGAGDEAVDKLAQLPVQARHQLRLKAYRPNREWRDKRLGRIGGYPSWWQQPEVPFCPDCGRLMYYVGQTYANAIRDDMVDAAVFAFHCEDCGVGTQVEQIT